MHRLQMQRANGSRPLLQRTRCGAPKNPAPKASQASGNQTSPNFFCFRVSELMVVLQRRAKNFVKAVDKAEELILIRSSLRGTQCFAAL